MKTMDRGTNVLVVLGLFLIGSLQMTAAQSMAPDQKRESEDVFLAEFTPLLRAEKGCSTHWIKINASVNEKRYEIDCAENYWSALMGKYKWKINIPDSFRTITFRIDGSDENLLTSYYRLDGNRRARRASITISRADQLLSEANMKPKTINFTQRGNEIIKRAKTSISNFP